MSSTEVTTTVVNPASGEVIALSDATDLLAAERHRVVELKKALDQYAAAIDEELVRRLDLENTRSAEVGGYRIETKAPTTTTFDPVRLAVAIHDLIAEGKLGESVVERVFIPQPEKINKAEVNKLLKHADPVVRDWIARVGEETEQRRTVTVKEVG